MQSVTLSTDNDLAALPVLQATARAFVRAIGEEDLLAGQIELVLEELFTNIIEHAYLPGQRERIELTLGAEGEFLDLTMRFRGIPFDSDYLRQYEQADLADMLEGGGRGIGLRLIRQFCDRISYLNLGGEGQEIHLQFGRSADRPLPAEPASFEDDGEKTPTPTDISIRLMLPSEAAAISKLAYFAYNYSYAYEQIYDPEQVRSLNEQGRLISYVAVDATAGIIGHSAFSPDDRSDLYEMCSGIVDPRFRGSGCLNALADHHLNEARNLGVGGVFVTAVTTHPYSQKAALKKGLRESALFLSRVEPVTMRSIRERATVRESMLFMAMLFSRPSRGPYHAPAHHRPMLERISANLGTAPDFIDSRNVVVPPENGRLEQVTDDYRAGHIFIHAYGRDTEQQVVTCLRRWQLDRLETIYLYLPLWQPPTATLCDRFEAMGLFFCGLRPGHGGRDWLTLQFFNNQRYDYGQLKTASDFAGELLEYVRERDPARGL